MQYKGRVFAIGVVGLFNVIRYIYYHQYLGLPFEASFFIITLIFLSIAWWCGKQFDRAKYYSEKDPLTNTYNRRAVEQLFKKLSSASEKSNKKLGIIMIDLDNFKEVNDTYGHLKGDELLKEFSSKLLSVAGINDVVIRWGGDEFIMLIPEIREDFEESYVQNLQIEMQGIHITSLPSIGASIGFAIYPDQGKEFHELILEADTAMYKTKELKLET